MPFNNKELEEEINEINTRLKKIETEIESITDPTNDTIVELTSIRKMLISLIDIPKILRITQTEEVLIKNKLLILKGDAGVGKSQLFANASEKNIKENRYSILILGQSFLTKQSIFEQVISKLNLDRNFDDFLLILENIGEQSNTCITLFFDAINETASKEIWKDNLNLLMKKLNKFNYIRMAFSLRSGYEDSLLDESTKNKINKKEIAILHHKGFRTESIEATRKFLNGYNIPFSPTSFLQFEITNPLFLTFFCKTYTGEEIDMLELFDLVIQNADVEIQKAIGYDGSNKLLPYLINEIIEYNISKKINYISTQDLLKLEFWETYGITSNKIPFLTALQRTDILYTTMENRIEYYYLSYNLLKDFLIAKSIMNKHNSKDELIDYMKNDLLLIDDNNLVNPDGINIFIVISMLFSEKYNEECIYIVKSLGGFQKQNVINKYLKSFSMRKSTSIDVDSFTSFLQEFPVNYSDLWRVLIENSTKSKHPLNADYLHHLLIKLPLAKRDAIWTTYINGLSNKEDGEERLYQLVSLFYSGDTLHGMSKNNLKLLLTLFSWLLSSTNRDLRDKTSKAMIEILKKNFNLCLGLLEKFETVNDPYIIQRLYGIVFGACVGRISKSHLDFKKLTTFVYNSIFEKTVIYPDILLRDYARLIIEKYLHDFSNDIDNLNFSKVIPPYTSFEIPNVNKSIHDDNKPGFNRISWSMQPNGVGGPGMYGDFGRYVFQSALNYFVDINLEKIYNYSLHYIERELKYTDDLFGDYDTRTHHPFDRSNGEKYERIGKKYQWIAMYHILAIVSDTHKIKGDSERDDYTYKGAYDPYVRDFDPTLNDSFIVSNDMPKFIIYNNFDIDILEDIAENPELIGGWLEADIPYFSAHSEKFSYIDSTGVEWILLNQYDEKKEGERDFINSTNSQQRIWSMSSSYLVKDDQFNNFKEELMDKNFIGRWFPEAKPTHRLYHGEYPWSYSCNEIQLGQWHSYEVRTGESYFVKQGGKIPTFFKKLEGDGKTYNVAVNFEEQTWEKEIHKTKNIGELLPTYAELSWEEEYDYSNSTKNLNFYFPTKLLYDGLKLRQKASHGYYYNENDELIAFDGRLSEVSSGLLIRKKYLSEFLKYNKLKLFWTCMGEKQYFSGLNDQKWSEWSGFLYFDGEEIFGTMTVKNINI